MSVRIKTGIRKDASFNENLVNVRKAVAKYGPEIVISRLEEMITLFYWVKNDEDQKEKIENLIRQLEFDAYVLHFLIEERERPRRVY